MSKVLAALSGKAESEIKTIVSELEDRSGYPSEDARFLAAHAQDLRAKISQLGLDPDDTTGPELYHALLSHYERDAATLERALGINEAISAQEKSKKILQLVGATTELPEVWTLKNNATRDMIKKLPPKHLMKKLHYRSVESLIKHESAPLILVGADLCEPATWHKKAEAYIARLGTDKYELRTPSLLSLSEKLNDLTQELALVNGLVGAVALVPRLETPALSAALSILDGLEAISENGLKHEFHSANPALAWWSGAEHLLFFNNGEPVSLNFKDVSKSHLLGRDFAAREVARGQQTHFSELMSRYRRYIEDLPSELNQAEASVSGIFKPKLELMPEVVEV